jgi:hypothetical protein
MSEVKRDPIITHDANGDELATFDANHTLADIARWLCRNPVEGEEVGRMIGSILAGTEGMAMQ